MARLLSLVQWHVGERLKVLRHQKAESGLELGWLCGHGARALGSILSTAKIKGKIWRKYDRIGLDVRPQAPWKHSLTQLLEKLVFSWFLTTFQGQVWPRALQSEAQRPLRSPVVAWQPLLAAPSCRARRKVLLVTAQALLLRIRLSSSRFTGLEFRFAHSL